MGFMNTLEHLSILNYQHDVLNILTPTCLSSITSCFDQLTDPSSSECSQLECKQYALHGDLPVHLPPRLCFLLFDCCFRRLLCHLVLLMKARQFKGVFLILDGRIGKDICSRIRCWIVCEHHAFKISCAP